MTKKREQGNVMLLLCHLLYTSTISFKMSVGRNDARSYQKGRTEDEEEEKKGRWNERDEGGETEM